VANRSVSVPRRQSAAPVLEQTKSSEQRAASREQVPYALEGEARARAEADGHGAGSTAVAAAR
jgi:hypothetical protein